jgi:hypothetical protein
MKNHIQQVVCILFIMLATASNAQQIIPCLTHEHEQEQRKTDPGYAISENALEDFTRNFNPEQKSNATIIIPVVFHVLHEYGSENISKEQILDQLRTLNEEYPCAIQASEWWIGHRIQTCHHRSKRQLH